MPAEVQTTRGQWRSQIESFLACLGYAVGFGNVWRFPYLCYKNGGGVFLIPYIIALVIAGIPLFFMELSLGQFASLGPNCIFGKFAPIFQGIGWGMIMVSALISVYYNMIIAWVLYYFVMSMRSKLEWSSCQHDWSTLHCRSKNDDIYCRETLKYGNDSVYFEGKCRNTSYILQNNVMQKLDNPAQFNLTWKSPADEYFHNQILQINKGLYTFGDTGSLSWQLVLALIGAWLLVFFCLFKGIQSSGKVVYVTAIVPYVFLFILLIRGLTLPGAVNGILYFVKPDWSKLAEKEVWTDAATQLFFSLSLAFGGLLTVASYNDFRHNCLKEAVLVPILDTLTSILAGLVVFSIVGYMGHELKRNVENVTTDGPGLVFITYAESLAHMPVGPLWSTLFFLMLILLGVDSQFILVDTVVSALMDQFPILRQRRRNKRLLLLAVCTICFLAGLPLCTKGGMYLFKLMDYFVAGYCVVLLGFLECIVVTYIYGLKRFLHDIQSMLGFDSQCLKWYLRISWYALTPLFLLLILIITFVDAITTQLSYQDYIFTSWLQAIGWALSCLSTLVVVLFAIYQTVNFLVNNRKLIDLVQPTRDLQNHFPPPTPYLPGNSSPFLRSQRVAPAPSDTVFTVMSR